MPMDYTQIFLHPRKLTSNLINSRKSETLEIQSRGNIEQIGDLDSDSSWCLLKLNLFDESIDSDIVNLQCLTAFVKHWISSLTKIALLKTITLYWIFGNNTRKNLVNLDFARFRLCGKFFQFLHQGTSECLKWINLIGKLVFFLLNLMFSGKAPILQSYIWYIWNLVDKLPTNYKNFNLSLIRRRIFRWNVTNFVVNSSTNFFWNLPQICR